MNTGNIKKYAPKARTRFIETMTRQAARYGISSGHKGEGHVAPTEVRGDVMLISALDGQTHSFPKALRGPREALAKWVTQLGFEQAMEQAAYSWFNRLCAIRFMELKGYLDHGRRVLSHPDHEGGFQILDDCLEVDLPGLDTARVRELKLDGTQDEALYRELLLAQCHALHEAMPFLFEPLDDASELLLPDNLTKTDSLIRELVEAIPEEDWQDVEVIGWLYQFYIAEKKDQVIGKVVKSEDIPAATQLFTPNWIVQYLVQNSVGRQWLQTYPDSPLKGEMPYYIEPAEQEPEVQAQLDAITPASIDPETIKVLDPACGSGHILVEAYNVLKAIYEERGYRSRDIPKLVLENNLFGLDIDDRAAQLASFALLMKAREDDRRIFSRGVRLNVMALQSTQHLDVSTLWRDLNLTGDWHQGQSQSLFEGEQQELSSNDSTYKAIVDLIERFQDAKTFGSLIEVPNSFEAPLKSLVELLTGLAEGGDTMQKTAARQLLPVVQQAWVLAQRYEAVVANPPYLGGRGVTGVPKVLAPLAKGKYAIGKIDAYAMFVILSNNLAVDHGVFSSVVKEEILYLPSLSELRKFLLEKSKVSSIWRIGSGAFSVRAAAYVANKNVTPGRVKIVRSSRGDASKLGVMSEWDQNTFDSLPYCIIDDDLPSSVVEILKLRPRLGDFTTAKQGLSTTDNERFLRYWWEISASELQKSRENPEKKWYPHNKGGSPRKWYGNVIHAIDYRDNGSFLLDYVREKYPKISDPEFIIRNRSSYFKESITWSRVRSSGKRVGFRLSPEGHVFDTAAMCFSHPDIDNLSNLAFLNSSIISDAIQFLSPGTDLNSEFDQLPACPEELKSSLSSIASRSISASKELWDREEVSMEFSANSMCLSCEDFKSWERSFLEAEKGLVLEINQLQNEIDRLVCDYNSREANEKQGFKSYAAENIDSSVSPVNILMAFSIGCMFGRFSLDKMGLVLANQGETIHDYIAKIPEPSFVPDENAIIPLTDQEWFPDDATNRFRDFVRTVWGEERLQENLDFVAESLCLHAIKPKKGEAALETIRRYLSTQFYKDHLRTYKKRPIYWLFSSGKQKAFECLVYLHRYNESTLAEMRTDYVIPLTEKLAGYVEKLEKDKEASASAAEAKRIEKELSKLYKQQAELNAFDEKLRHYADQRISLDLDDGVKVNYGKLGDLLAEVKAVTGEKAG